MQKSIDRLYETSADLLETLNAIRMKIKSAKQVTP